MSAFEDFVQQELPKRGYLNSDVAQETIIIRRGPGPRQFEAIQLNEGEVLTLVNGQLQGVPAFDPTTGGLGLRKAILTVTVPSTTWTIDHEYGSEDVLVQAFDDNKFVMIPNSIQVVDGDTVVLTFNTPVTGVARLLVLD